MNIFSRYKKYFLIILFLALIFLLGYLLWRVFFFTSPQNVPVQTATGTINGLPSSNLGSNLTDLTGGNGTLPGNEGEQLDDNGNPLTGAGKNTGASEIALGGLTQTNILSKSPASNPVLSSDNNVKYYNKSDGIFYTVDSNGNISPISDKVFYNASNVVWAPDANKAIIEYPDGNKILYNFSTKKQTTLPAYWEDFSFSPGSDQIISKSIGLDPENRWLMVSNDDGSEARTIEAIGTNADKVYPSWSPNQQIIAMYTRGVDFDRQEVFFVGQNDENFKSTIIEGRGFQSQWSKDGEKLLYSVYHTRDDLKPRLWIVSANGDNIGQNRKSFNIQTWADKCTFATNTEIYCAVPESLEKGAGLFPELADSTKDNLFKIDLESGTQKLIAIPDNNYNISQIIVDENQESLYFTDKSTGFLYEINLK